MTSQTVFSLKYFLAFDEGARLEIINKPNMNDADESLQKADFMHIAFSVWSKEKVVLWLLRDIRLRSRYRKFVRSWAGGVAG